MPGGAYRELFAAIAECAAALSGLLFVAMTVVGRLRPTDRPVVVRQVRAAASIVALTNALTVSCSAMRARTRTPRTLRVLACAQ